jgi:signal transduction histidine kinase
VGAHGIMFDDTDRHGLQEELRQSRDTARRAVLAKSRMLAAVSHDLGQPLQSMMMFAALLEDEVDRERMAQTLSRLRIGMSTLKSMLDSIVEAARTDSGAVKVNMCDFCLDPVLDELESYYGPRAEKKGLAFRVVRTSQQVRSDPVLLGRMIRNLVENAMRYTVKGEVTVLVAGCGGRVSVTVCDTGPGIAPDQQDLVWEEFNRGGSAAPGQPKGLGLGLAIVRNLARLLGHEVGMSSAPGSGSVFWVNIEPPPRH